MVGEGFRVMSRASKRQCLNILFILFLFFSSNFYFRFKEYAYQFVIWANCVSWGLMYRLFLHLGNKHITR